MRLRSLQRSPDPLAGFKGPTSKEREGRGGLGWEVGRGEGGQEGGVGREGRVGGRGREGGGGRGGLEPPL